MPRANWGIDASDVDDFDRSTQYKPYAGPIPSNGVYLWQINVLKFIAADNKKLPQLRVGLELVPREDRDEEKYEGYFLMAFLQIADSTRWKYVPFLDAIGVTGKEFTGATIIDQEGNVRKIGKWRNTGEEWILAELKDGQDQNGNSRKEIGTFLPVPDDYYEDEEDEDYDDDEYDEEDPV
jgi:hypothetical protein